jgi:isopentenyl-diphosphate delta-isomerase
VSSDWVVFASGGLRNGIDIAKSIALGANLGGMAGIFLRVANESLEKTIDLMEMIIEQIRISMFASGSKSLQDLTSEKLQKIN